MSREIKYGACAKHQGHSMIDCPLCKMEKSNIKNPVEFNEIMKDQLITFDTANLAKDKEFFDKDLSGGVRLSQEYLYDEKGNCHIMSSALYDSDIDFTKCYNAPTQSLLQKWLREEHNIHPWVEHKSTYYFPRVGHYNIGDNLGKDYEKALEIALQEAL